MLLDLIQSLEEKLALLRGCSRGPAASQQQYLLQLVSRMTVARQQDVAAAEPPITFPLSLSLPLPVSERLSRPADGAGVRDGVVVQSGTSMAGGTQQPNPKCHSVF